MGAVVTRRGRTLTGSQSRRPFAPGTPRAVTTSTLVYATIIPNSSVVSGAWRQWQVTIDFLSDVDPAIQAVVERTRAP